MNSFMIKDTQGNEISLRELDIEVAAFWGKEIDEKKYAHPYPKVVPEDNSERAEMKAYHEDIRNSQDYKWTRIIGDAISNLDEYSSGWENVAENILKDMFVSSLIKIMDNNNILLPKIAIISIEQEEDMGLTAKSNTYGLYHLSKGIERFRPFIDLINYFNEKGYKPIQIKE